MVKLQVFIMLGLLFLISVSADIFEEADYTYLSVDVVEGWNLIAGFSFLEEDIHSSSTLPFSSLVSSYYVDNADKMTYSVYPDYDVVEADGLRLYSQPFWVFSLSSGTFAYRVSPSYVSYTGGYNGLYSGVNLLAVNSELYSETLEANVGDCSILSAYSWDSSIQDWSELNLALSLESQLGASYIGNGISIEVENDCQIIELTIAVSAPSSSGGSSGGGSSGGGGGGGSSSSSSSVVTVTTPIAPSSQNNNGNINDNNVPQADPAVDSILSTDITDFNITKLIILLIILGINGILILLIFYFIKKL
ncbi:MAG: hypothetical protein ACI83O_000562 [Patescibacteria group bacterium]|jgi:hypothetical protein